MTRQGNSPSLIPRVCPGIEAINCKEIKFL
jgi:hypothetical protein